MYVASLSPLPQLKDTPIFDIADSEMSISKVGNIIRRLKCNV